MNIQWDGGGGADRQGDGKGVFWEMMEESVDDGEMVVVVDVMEQRGWVLGVSGVGVMEERGRH